MEQSSLITYEATLSFSHRHLLLHRLPGDHQLRSAAPPKLYQTVAAIPAQMYRWAMRSPKIGYAPSHTYKASKTLAEYSQLRYQQGQSPRSAHPHGHSMAATASQHKSRCIAAIASTLLHLCGGLPRLPSQCEGSIAVTTGATWSLAENGTGCHWQRR